MTKAGPFRAARCPPAPLSVPVSGPLPVAEVSQDEGRAAGMMPRWTSLLTAPWIPLLALVPSRPPAPVFPEQESAGAFHPVVNIPGPVGQTVPSQILDSALIW